MGHPKRLTFNWGTKYAKGRKDDWHSIREFKNQFQITGMLLEDFLSYVEQQEIEVDRSELEKDGRYLKSTLKAEIAGAIWGKSAYYQIFVSNDPQVVVAMTYLDQASTFLSSH